MPVVIDGPGVYETRCRMLVNITAIVPGAGQFCCIGHYPHPYNVEDRWAVTGKLYFSSDSANDIMRKV